MEVHRFLLIAGATAAVVLSLLILRPWEATIAYRIDYLRSKAIEIAECIESGKTLRLTDDWVTENASIELVITRSCEEPIVLLLNYTRVLTPSPISVDEVVRGKPEYRFAFFREVAVYVNGSHLIIDPKPVISYVKTLEYNRTIHLVKLVLFSVHGELRKGATLTLNTTVNVVQYRTYDYSGESSVVISGQNAVSFTVEENDCLKIVIAIEKWVSG